MKHPSPYPYKGGQRLRLNVEAISGSMSPAGLASPEAATRRRSGGWGWIVKKP